MNESSRRAVNVFRMAKRLHDVMGSETPVRVFMKKGKYDRQRRALFRGGPIGRVVQVFGGYEYVEFTAGEVLKAIKPGMCPECRAETDRRCGWCGSSGFIDEEDLL